MAVQAVTANDFEMVSSSIAMSFTFCFTNPKTQRERERNLVKAGFCGFTWKVGLEVCYTFLVLSVTVWNLFLPFLLLLGTHYYFLSSTTKPIQEPKIKVKITRKIGEGFKLSS